MSDVNRGDIWLADFGDPVVREQGFRRPTVIISDDRLNRGPSGVVVSVPLTSRWRGLASHIEVDHEDTGLNVVSYARCEDLRSLSIERLLVRVGSVPADVMFKIERTVAWILGLRSP